MAEGDSILRLTRRLDRALAGAVIVRSDLRTPRLATVRLEGAVFAAVVARGKHLLMRVQPSAPGGVGLTLHSHLRLQGRWRVVAPGRRLGGRAHERRAILALADGRTLLGERLPVLDLVRTDREHLVVGHLGPDVLGEDWDAPEAVRRLRRMPGRQVVEALLDQRNLAGPGNLYAVECAFLARVHPLGPIAEVDTAALVEVVYATMQRQLRRGDQATTGIARRGQDHWVYGRAGRPCRQCGAAIAFRPGDGVWIRPVWWCPVCQPMPAGSADPGRPG